MHHHDQREEQEEDERKNGFMEFCMSTMQLLKVTRE